MSWRRGRWSGYGWYPPAPPKKPPPQHGIKVKKLGATWWGRRWMEALEKLSWEYSNRLARGRTYARAGRVHDLMVAPGVVSARVTGSSPRPYQVALQIRPLTPAAWTKAIGVMSKKAIFTAQLLAGEMPEEIDDAFRPAGASLFPARAADLSTECSCPDWANPCKHIAATHYVLGEAFDRDPFLLFELRGRTKEQVLDALRRSRAGGGSHAARAEAAPPGTGTAAAGAPAIPAVPLDATGPDAFERPRAALGALRFRIEPPAAHAAVLRQLGSPASWSLDESVSELLGPAFEAAGVMARAIALGSTEALDRTTDPPATQVGHSPVRSR
jgi:uncharacterized Zn finger protein